MTLEYRSFERAHLDQAAALCAATIPYLPFSGPILAERIIADPDFDPRLNWTVWDGDQLVAVACGAPANAHLQCPSGVKLFAVRSDDRRHGIASELFDRIEAELAARGAEESLAIIAGNNRFMQGLDLRYTEALCFLEQRGYARVGDGMDMDVDLRARTFDAAALEQDLRDRHGISFQRATPTDHERVWRYVAAEFSRPRGTGAEVGRRWAHLATMGLACDPPSLHLAEDAEGPIGFVVTQVAAPGRLGPMGVSRTARNRRVGKVLALRALHDLKAAGRTTGVIYGAGPYGFYAKIAAARISAVFWRLRKRLAPA